MHKTDLLTITQFNLEVGKSFWCAVAVYRAIGNKFENFTQLLSGCTNPTRCYNDLAEEAGEGWS